MKTSKFTCTSVLVGLLFALALAGCSKEKQTAEAKPYPLDTCLVCGMKFAEMEKPYVFVYQGQQIKVCDESEKAIFEKDPGTYMKKLADAATALKNRRN
jgi:nitrous oxide reductase accessory protein NosL